MALSSNSFFHFTSEIKYLSDILAKGFWPRYCKEYGWGKEYVDFALPMVCFCDIPLTQIHPHAEFYGGYGIGIRRSWIIKNKCITPVQYVSLKSIEYNYIKRLLTQLKNDKLSEDGYKKLSLVKKVSGDVFNKQNIQVRKKLYDEREWRYVPNFTQINSLLIKLNKKDTFDTNTLSESTKDKRVPFSYEDIRYIIILNEAERTKMISIVKVIFADIPPKKQDMVISRILSLQQIKNDF